MARARRKRLLVRQSLAYREGKCKNASWWVGYFDPPIQPSRKIYIHPDDQFRTFGSRPTREEAEAFAKELAKKKNKEYVYD
jgi:hypothetical protein